jgi:hypothetical protein
MAFLGPDPAQIARTTVFKLLQMMGNQFIMGICAHNGLWDEWEVFSGGGHHSTNDDPPSKDDVFKAFTFTDLKHAIEPKLSLMMKDRRSIGLFG